MMASYFDMGGYAGYVWPAYGVAAVILGGMVAASLIGSKARRAQLALLERTHPRRRRKHAAMAALDSAPEDAGP
jgi:heme exporter protein D